MMRDMIANGESPLYNQFKMWLDLRKTGELGESPKDKPVEIYLRILEKIEKSKFTTEKKRLLFICKSGLTPAALKFAKSNGVEALDNNLEAVWEDRV